MIYNVNELRKGTVALISQINKTIEAVEKRAREMGIEVTDLVDQNDVPVISPLLSAKATAYNTLVMLQTGEATSRASRTTRRQ